MRITQIIVLERQQQPTNTTEKLIYASKHFYRPSCVCLFANVTSPAYHNTRLHRHSTLSFIPCKIKVSRVWQGTVALIYLSPGSVPHCFIISPTIDYMHVCCCEHTFVFIIFRLKVSYEEVVGGKHFIRFVLRLKVWNATKPTKTTT